MIRISDKESWAVVFLVLAPLLWAGNFIIGKLAQNTIPPFTFAFFRWLMVVILMSPFAIKPLRTHWDYIKTKWKYFFFLGFLSTALYPSFLYLGLHFTTAVSAGLINAVLPVMIMLISIIAFEHRITFFEIISAIASLIGVFIILTGGNDVAVSLFSLSFNLGNLIILIAVAAWALFSVLLKQYPSKISPFLFLFITAVAGTLFLFPAYIVEISLGKHISVGFFPVLSIGYAAIFSSILAFIFWNLGINKLGAVKAGYFFNLLPVFNVILAFLFLKENMQIYDYVGVMFVFAGVIISYKVKKSTNLIGKVK